MSAIAAKALQDIDVLVGRVSSVTGLSTQDISAQLEEANVKAFRLNDVILISPDDFDSIIDDWADSIKAKLSIKKTSGSSAPVAKASSSSPVAKASSSAPVAKKKTQKKAPVSQAPAKKSKAAKSTGQTLAWPKGFEKNVSHLYTHTLKRILPEASAQRKLYLEAIANQTAAGEKLAEELVAAIVKTSTRKLAPEKVMAGLIAKCSSML